MATPIHVNEKTLAAIKEGLPVARSTLRKALLAVRQASGSMFDVDAYILDQRPAQSRRTERGRTGRSGARLWWSYS